MVLADASGKSEAAARKALGDKLKDVSKDADALLRRPRRTWSSSAWNPPRRRRSSTPPSKPVVHVIAEKPSCVRAADMERLVKKRSRSIAI